MVFYIMSCGAVYSLHILFGVYNYWNIAKTPEVYVYKVNR